MIPARRPPGNKRRAAAAVEFALTLPILMVLLSSILDYGWYFWRRSALTMITADAVRLGVAIPRSSTPGPETMAEIYAQTMMMDAGVPCPGPDCVMQTTRESHGGYSFLRLQTTLQYEPLVGMVPTPDTVRAFSTMMLEDQPDAFYP